VDPLSLALAASLGFAVGATLAWILGAARASASAAGAAFEREARERAEASLAQAVGRKDAAEESLARADEQLKAARTSLDEQRRFVESAGAQLERAFGDAAAKALHGNTEQFLALAKAKLEAARGEATGDLDSRRQAIEALVKPLTDSVKDLRTHADEIERKREHAYGKIGEQVRSLLEATAGVEKQAVTLSTALRGSQVRGRWGEIALQNIVELAGMTEHVDFETQRAIVDGKRPDLVVRLPKSRRIAVDSKAPVSAYLEAVEAKSDAERAAALDRHARSLRSHVKALAAKDYAAGLAGVDLVVLFIPADAFLSAALETDPHLLRDALGERVVLASPSLLLALLRTVALSHHEESVARDAAAILAAAKTHYERVVAFSGHFEKIGKGLHTAVAAFNDGVASFESRVLPSGRELERLKVAETAREALEAPRRVDLLPSRGEPRVPSAPAA
jgi:DNA recombination protein RmuC